MHCTFFFIDTPTTEIYTLSLHDALPILVAVRGGRAGRAGEPLLPALPRRALAHRGRAGRRRSEEHTSELQSHVNLVCRLLLEKKKNQHVRLTAHTIDLLPIIRTPNLTR